MSYVPPARLSTRNPFLPDSPPAKKSLLPRQASVSSLRQDRQLKEFTYDLSNKSGKPWAVLSLLGDMEHSKAIPAFVEGNTVTGEVRLDLESDPIQTVVLSLKGQVITGVTPHEMYTFIDVPTTLWSRSMGDPRNPGSASNETKWTEKLRGQYVWPFSISVPPTVSLRDEVFRLPPTFFERHTRAQIEYEISVRFTRTKLRSDHKLSTIINYMPLSRPGPFSYLRQLAYQQNTAMLGPDSDPEGWETLPYVRTRGKLPGSTRSFEAKCRLSLAKPLCYTRGSVIPCALVVECGDPEGLELLSSPDVVVMRMRRSVRYHTGEKTAANFGDIPNKIVWKDELDHSELATWWPAADRALEVDSTDAIAVSAWKRMLKGEIHLRPDLITSSAIAHFRIEYFVVLFPFDALGYESLDTEPLIVEPVEIASDFASGPRPLNYSTPSAAGM